MVREISFVVLFIGGILFLPSCQSLKMQKCQESTPLLIRGMPYKPIYNHKIFTSTLFIYINYKSNGRIDQLSTDSIKRVISSDVLNAFRSAITLWGVSLLLIRNNLDSQLADYLNSMTVKNERGSLYNAPQIVEVNCSENASINVDVYMGNFPGDQRDVAKAQLKGRRIMLNRNENNFYYSNNSFVVIQNDICNLTSVIAHELGHSFGLRHPKRSYKGRTLMNAYINDMSYSPSIYDGKKFSAILKRNITGNGSSYFGMKKCSGLKRR